MQKQAKTTEKSRGELIEMKRKITAAGRLQDKIAADFKELKALKATIRVFEVEMAIKPDVPVVLVSGEYVAELGEEKREHVTGPKANLALFGYLGLDKFMDLCTFPITDMRNAVGVDLFNEVCPLEYSGGGRVFKIRSKK